MEIQIKLKYSNILIMEETVDIKDIWPLTRLDNPAIVNNNIRILPFLFRFLLHCDQCHDFIENATRNNWRNNQDEVFQQLQESYTKDMNWLFSKLQNTTNKDMAYINNMFKLDLNIAKNTNNIVNKIDSILLDMFKIRSYSSSDFPEQTKPCSGSANLLQNIVSLTSSEDSNKSGNLFNITVDADNTNLNFASLLLFLCDNVIKTGGKTEIKIIETIATKYDAASGSGVINYIRNLVKSDTSLTSSISDDKTYKPIRINLKFDDLILISFGYTYDKSTNKASLLINNFFSKNINSSYNEDYTSVSSITKNVKFNQNKKLQENVCFKTIGDFGQILTYYIVSGKNKKETIDFFITFDKICSRISALFLPYTLYENKETKQGKFITPLNVFLNVNDIETIKGYYDVLKNLGVKRKRTEFGKTNKIKSMSLKELKTKLKSVGMNITKLNSKGKRIPLTLREVQNKAKTFKNLQMRAKKINIRITYLSKDGTRKYKSYKRLLSDVQNRNKTSFSSFGG
jgi:hypothetical protein